jgi:hypothetical protein
LPQGEKILYIKVASLSAQGGWHIHHKIFLFRSIVSHCKHLGKAKARATLVNYFPESTAFFVNLLKTIYTEGEILFFFALPGLLY